MDNPPLAFIFREAQDRDLSAIDALNIHCFAASGLINKDKIQHALQTHDGHLLIAENKSGEFAGFLLTLDLEDNGTRYLDVEGLAVEEKYRRSGLGRAFMNCAEAYARTKEFNGLSLYVRDNNEPAQKLYDDLGYKELSRYPDAYRDGSAAIHMIKFF